ncbi:hypothetical protein BDV59DRAFT_100236 [Aspergillus ambiguus]|uniref:uncharacterized protein n=1 Tax=Aspergillus ambiguus TaxID=176160 RepID=UPI003CCD1FD9
MFMSTVRRAFGSRPLHLLQHHLPVLMISRLLRITLSTFLLPLSNAILVTLYIWRHVSVSVSYTSPLQHRQMTISNVHFYPKTVLVTGVNTPHGLAISRKLYSRGHRVVGADISERKFIPSGERFSKALVAFYDVSSMHYTAWLLDIVQREKVDVWIPCSPTPQATDDAIAREEIESRTSCVCVTLGTQLTNRLERQSSFVQYLLEKDLPVVENHHVQSRDTIHKILHRSPTKVYRMRRPCAAMHDNNALVLPKRTLSQTYSEVSEIQISRDSPWIMQQQTRLGEFSAELLVVCGQVQALQVFAVGGHSPSKRSRLDEGLATAIYKLMGRFASKGGTQMTGHLNVQLMVDEEFDANSVRYVIHVSGCTLGAHATGNLLQMTPAHTLVRGYLAVLAPQVNGATSMCHESNLQPTNIVSTTQRKYSLYQAVRQSGIRRVLPVLYPILQKLDKIIDGLSDLLCVWKDWRFSSFDPLPWWWHTHIYQPWEDAVHILDGIKEYR